MFSKIALRLVAFFAIARGLANGSSSQAMPVSVSQVSFPPARQQAPTENFVSGEVVRVSPDKIVIKKSQLGNIVLHLSPKTDVWSGLWVKNIPIQVGDRIDANVQRRPNGSFDVQKMWVNIVNLVGNISSLEKKAAGLQLSLQNRFLGSVVVKIDPRTQVNRLGKETPYSANAIELHKGDVVRIIGRRLSDRSVIATKLFLE